MTQVAPTPPAQKSGTVQSAYPSRWLAVLSVAQKIGGVRKTLQKWVKRTDVDIRSLRRDCRRIVASL